MKRKVQLGGQRARDRVVRRARVVERARGRDDAVPGAKQRVARLVKAEEAVPLVDEDGRGPRPAARVDRGKHPLGHVGVGGDDERAGHRAVGVRQVHEHGRARGVEAAPKERGGGGQVVVQAQAQRAFLARNVLLAKHKHK